MRSIYKINCIVFILILQCFLKTFFVSAQFNCLFDHYSQENGLSHGTITAITKDSKGYLWFGTWDGINKFDGYKFTTYKTRPGDTLNLSSNRINEIIEDKYGFLWIKSYDNKIFRFDRQTEIFNAVLKKQVNIEDIFKSRLGDIWLISPDSGLYRAITNTQNSSYKIFHYLEQNEQSGNTRNNISSVYEDAYNNIWILLNKGINCLKYNPNGNNYETNNDIYKINKIINNETVNSIIKWDDKIWFGTNKGNVFYYDFVRQIVKNANLPNSASVSIIRASGKGTLYIATMGNGLIEYNPVNQEIVNHFKKPEIKNIVYIFVDSEGLVWIETERKGVTKLNPDSKKISYIYQETDVGNTLQLRNRCSFHEDNHQVLWIILKDGGFGYYNRKTRNLDYFYNKPGSSDKMISNFVTRFYRDQSDKILWLSTYYKGIEKITFLESRFRFHTLEPNPTNQITNEVRALFEDSKGNLWIGTKEGKLYILNKNHDVIKIFFENNNLDNGLVYSIMEDNEKNIWLAAKNGGLYKISLENGLYRFTRYMHDPEDKNSLSSNDVYTVIQDKKGRIWAGTYGGGLNILEKKDGQTTFKNSNNSFHKYPVKYGNRIRHLQEDSNGRIWIGSTEGLLMVNPEQNSPDDYIFHHYRKTPGEPDCLGNNDVYCIFKDRADTIWLGTLGGGLHKMIHYPVAEEQPRFQIFTREDGLPSDVILSIQCDNRNNIWMSTENGISQFNRETKLFRNYDEYDGLHKTTFSEAASCKRSSGEIYFGSFHGFYSFLPGEFTEKKKPVNLELTNFQLFYRDMKPGETDSPLSYSISETDKIELNYDQTVFTVEYVALEYRAQHKIHYSYILKGFEDTWHNVKNQRIATYTNIPPGKYLFKVKVTNPELKGRFSEEQLQIVINPPPWKTAVAYIIYVVLLIIIIEIARRIITTMMRLRHKVAVEKEMTDLKMRFFTNISHELRTPLTLILSPTEELLNSEKLTSTGIEYLYLVRKNAKRMQRLINQLLDFRKIQHKKMILKLTNIDIVLFVREICQNFMELASGKNITYTIESEIEEQKIWFDESKIDTVVFNLLSNAFKFSSEQSEVKVNIRVNQAKNQVEIHVSDQGIGIPKEKSETIFRRFETLDNSEKLCSVGTGIGLSLSKELIDLHNGDIWFTSIEGKGTTFSIALKPGKAHFNPDLVTFIENQDKQENKPVRMQNKKTCVEKQNNIPEIDSQCRVLLIVEDNTDLRQFIKSLFLGSSRVEEAADGIEGLSKAKTIMPDIIISDVMMPKMDGIELTDKLKSDFETSHIPVIILTAKSSIESQLQGLKYGADAYITKPFNSQYIVARVENLMQQRSLLVSKYSEQVKLSDIAKQEITVTDRDSEFIKTVVETIDKNLSNSNFTIENIAEETGLGRTSFFKKVKGLTGVAPVEFVKNFRLNKSARLLETGQYNISEVSFMVGFSEPGYFSKCFKEKFNCSPSMYLLNKNKNRKAL